MFEPSSMKKHLYFSWFLWNHFMKSYNNRSKNCGKQLGNIYVRYFEINLNQNPQIAILMIKLFGFTKSQRISTRRIIVYLLISIKHSIRSYDIFLRKTLIYIFVSQLSLRIFRPLSLEMTKKYFISSLFCQKK